MAESLNEIIAKFDNGKQRFELDPLFNKVVRSLDFGTDVYSVLDSLIVIIHEQNGRLIEIFEAKYPAGNL